MDCFKTYDDFDDEVLSDLTGNIKETLKIQYIILFRMWNLLEEVFDDFSGWDKSVLVPSEDETVLKWEVYDDYRLSDLLMLNYDKIYAYSEHKCCDLKDKVDEIVGEGGVDPAFLYDYVLKNNRSIFDTFFPGSSPLLGIKKFDEQIMPSRQIKDHNASIVLNEVGTGKTVSAIYAISDIIESSNKESGEAHILIVCPSNLKRKWEEDIRYNLGRYSYVMKRGEEKQACFTGHYKKTYFHGKEHCIFIMDNISSKSGEMCSFKMSSGSFWTMITGTDNVEPWDLVIIDECHLCNKNYSGLRAKNVMLLTATPIVKFDRNDQGGDIDSLDMYKEIIKSILKKNISEEINPLNDRIADESKLFTNFFREDLSIPSTERMIVFKETERVDGYSDMVTRIAEEKNWLVADHFAQDDEYLISRYRAICRDGLDMYLETNAKKEVLNDIIKEMETENDFPATIVFCEHQEVVQNLYSYFKEIGNRVVAMKCGNTEKINRDGTGNVILSLHQYIRKQCVPVILIITGKIGGTGLNMGDFDAVVHYELPYTSIALEQRFGRIDRMEGGRSGIKKMYFILNKESSNGEKSGIENRFFWFCVSKLNSTCRYLPVRNTVLFYPKIAEKFQSHFVKTLEMINRAALGNEASIEGRQLDTRIKERFEQIYGVALKDKIEDWIGYKESEEIRDSELRKLIEKLQNNRRTLMSNKRTRDAFRRFVSEYGHIVNLFDADMSEYIPVSSDSFVDDIVPEESEDEAAKEFCEDESEKSVDESIADRLYDERMDDDSEDTDLQKQYDLLMERIMRINPTKFKDKLSNGIYYYENGGLVITTVEQYREEAVNEHE